LVAEAVGIYELRHTAPNELPQHLKSWFYWLCVVGMSGIGAGLVYIYHDSGVHIVPLLALNIGASAPLILRQLTRSTPDLSPGRVG
jgi:hypothetical protein